MKTSGVCIPLFVVVALLIGCRPSAEPETVTGKAPNDEALSRAALPPDSAVITRIAFGSCNRQNLEQPLWDEVLNARPQLWIWLGDNVYADTVEPEEMQSIFDLQLSEPGYRKVVRAIPIIGTWDDHDYGANDAGKEYPMKEKAQQLNLDFLGEPADSPRRTQEGIYTSYAFGPEGQQTKLILLDTRYHRDLPGPNSDILGDAQWEWLESELSGSRADAHILVSSIQLLHPVPSKRMERWVNFPKAYKRMLALLRETEPRNLVILSGDRHFSEMAIMPGDEAPPTLIAEVTSSGMTHSWKNFPGEPNPLRFAGPYTGLHYGLIDIDWDNRSLIVEVRGPEQKVAYRHLFPME